MGALRGAGARARSSRCSCSGRTAAARVGSSASASTELLARLVPPTATRAPWIRALLQFGAVLCAGVAFAGPRWGTEQTLERGSGVDMVLALDASLSMLATDARPNRLERMKEEARRLLALSTGDRVGLLAFAGRSYILTPLTVDRGALELFLDNLDPSVVGQAGSSLSRAIRQGTDLLVATQTTSDRALVIMSDGEAFEPPEEVTAAAAHAAEAGVTVIAVGFGTEKGSTIPVRTAQGTQAEARREWADRDDALHTGAAQGCGHCRARRLHRCRRDGQGRAHPRRALDAASPGARVRERDRASRALSALPHSRRSCSCCSTACFATRRGRRRAAPAAATATALALCLLLIPLGAHAETGDDARRALSRRAISGGRRRVSARDPGALGLAAPRIQSRHGAHAGGSARGGRRRARARGDHRHLRRAPLQRALQPRPRAICARRATRSPARRRRPTRRRPRRTSARCSCARARCRRSGTTSSRRRRNRSRPAAGASDQQQNKQQQQQEKQRAKSTLDKRQAEQLLSSAQREERDVQAKKQKENQPERPPAGKDW